MGLPGQPLTLSPREIEALSQCLASARHNINNQLALIVAALELIRRKPDMAGRLLDNMAQQPDKIIEELRSFSETFDRMLQITRD